MKKIVITFIAVTTIVAGFISCTKSGSSTLSEADKATIAKSATEINEAFNTSKDYKAYANSYYAEDATVLYPNADAIKGRQAIISLLSTYGTDINVTPTILDVNGSADLAYVYGTVKMETNAKVELDRGKYIEIWKKQKDGRWQVIYDIFNTSVPMAADTTMKH